MAQSPPRDEIDLPSAMMAVRRRKQKFKKAKAEAEEIKFLNIVAMVDVLTILLIFLLKSVSVSTTTAPKTPNLTLPMSTTQIGPKEAVRVTIAKDKLFVQDEPVANINKGAIPDAELAADSPWIVPDLQAALLNMLRQNIVTAGGERDRFMLEILADKETPYHLLQQVAYTAGESVVDVGGKKFGFDTYNLKVRRGE